MICRWRPPYFSPQVIIYQNPWGGWSAFSCGTISGDFSSYIDALDWAEKNVAEYLELLEKYGGDIP